MATQSVVQARRPRSPRWSGLVFVILGIALGGLLIDAGNRVYALEGGVATLASYLPLGYAFSAGMVATVNPCGILLLPSLVAYYLSNNESTALTGWRRARKALLLGVMATLGFVLLFAVVGLIIGAGGRALAAAFPVGGLIIGVILVGIGAWLALSGRSLGLLAASQAMEQVRLGDGAPSGPRSLFLFGIGYAICSLSCTLPIFMVVAGAALAASGILAAVGQFISYALGMGVVLTLVILGAAFFQRAVGNLVRRLTPFVHRVAASFLLGAGLYIAHYWVAALGLLH